VRFSIGEAHELSGRRKGIFAAAYDGIDDDSFDSVASVEVRTELAWFEKNLPVPRIDVDEAVFFFDSDATRCANRVRHLARLLREAGRFVALQRLENPGRVVYEDDCQVAVIPWASAGDV